MFAYPEVAHPLEIPIPETSGRTACNFKYTELMQAIKDAKGDWVCCTDLSLISGRDLQQKATTVNAAAKVRKLRVQTTAQFGYLYCRLIGRGVKAVL